MAYYATTEDAKTALDNSGVVELFDDDTRERAIRWMWSNNATPEQAAAAFGLTDDHA
ncbi:hypothetical protein [Halorhodospira halophila]|uniref:hypothetical protein n=1 Tax=Halorhodospira halophila TaxID=1053 RepID=UPI0019144EB6|nr:hypothetical protein [Halorhodospira halophila]